MKFPIIESFLVVGLGLYVFVCPYSKVEESFNIQAIHDIIHFGSNISQYDHLQFPGVVPRTFCGSLLIAMLSSPVVYMMSALSVPKLWEQYAVRLCLGNAVLVGLFLYTSAVKEKFGPRTAQLGLFVTLTQFHFLFYASRTLPNTFALVLVLPALRSWIKQQHMQFIWLSGAAIIIFRFELSLFFGILLLMDLVYKRVSPVMVIKCAVPAGMGLTFMTVCIDSWFWRRYLWPEGEVLWFNTVMNKSSNWGTSPFLWYFYSALPRALSFGTLLLPVGMFMSPRVTQLVLPALSFVFVYSFLPHKELRFIIYVLPVLNTAVAEAIYRLWINREKSLIQYIFSLGTAVLLLGNLCTSGLFLYTSHHNYPGGEALYRLHQLENADTAVHLHIDVAAAQTGVSRFGQMFPKWIYNKTEGLEPGGEDMKSFTHLLIGDSRQLHRYEHSHIIMESISGYDTVGFQKKKFPFFFVKQKPKMWILKKK